MTLTCATTSERSRSESYTEDDYAVSGAFGTIAPLVDQDHYDTRRRASDRDGGDDGDGDGDGERGGGGGGDGGAERGRINFRPGLCGREGELDRLRSAFDDLFSGARVRATDAPAGNVVFVGGCSGVGKSALVRQFVRSLREPGLRSEGAVLFARGKCTADAAPLSPFSQLFSHLVGELREADLVEAAGATLRGSPEVGAGSEGAKALGGLWPQLLPLLDGTEGAAGRPAARPESGSASLNSAKEYALTLLKLLCDALGGGGEGETIGKRARMVLFLDDVQWADPPSLHVLSHLFSEKNLRIMFLCAYRSNEVNPEHPLQKVIDEVCASPSKSAEEESEANTTDDNGNGNDINSPGSSAIIELHPLPPSQIQRFVADSLSIPAEEASGLTRVIYAKTMGNIFYVRQAMEELVRKNALYYDVMLFRWSFAAAAGGGDGGGKGESKTELLANYISDDVVDSVRGKIRRLSEDLQRVLAVMAHVPNNALSVETLRALLNRTGWRVGASETVERLNRGVEEGMLLLSPEGYFIFSHDKVREASKLCVEEEERGELLEGLAEALLALYEEGRADAEWCIYVAADYLNSFETGTAKFDALELARLNSKVAKLAAKKGAMEKELELLGNGIRCLDYADKLWVEYELTLEMYNALIESQCFLGLYDEAKVTVEEVLCRARTLEDKLVAYRHRILCISVETRDYAKSLEEGIKVLNLYGYKFPASPTKTDLLKEGIRVKMAMHNRGYTFLLERPITDCPIMELFKNLTRYALLSGNDNMIMLLCWKAIRLALSKGVDRHLHTILVTLGNSMAKESDIKVAFEVANTAVLLSERHREDKGNYAYTQLVAYPGILFQLQSFQSGVDILLQCYKDLKLSGDVDTALGSAYNHFLAIFAAGVPIGPLVESKLLLIEEFATATENTSFAVIFKMQRQFILNLWKVSNNPTELKGDAFDEEDQLAALDSNGKGYKMTLRDTSTYRLQLAFVFNDETCMAKMLDVLRDYPMSDMLVPRLHLRLTFMGLSAYLLLQKRKSKTTADTAKSCLTHFKELSKLGSANATPVYHFLLAMKQPSVKSFELAIDSCAEAKFSHLEAMAKEQYGLYLCSRGDVSIGQDYLVSAYWLYYNWGAHAKSLAMRKEHSCIKNASKEQANNRIASCSVSDKSGSLRDKEQGKTDRKKKRAALFTLSTKAGPKGFGRKATSNVS